MKKIIKILVILASSLCLAPYAFADNLYREFFVIENDEIAAFTGNSPGEQFGSKVIDGDFNGEGVSDLAITAPFSSDEGNLWSGSVNVFLGGDRKFFEPDLKLIGASKNQQIGLNIVSGDFDNDGADDLAISSYQPSLNNDLARKGKVTIFYGGEIFAKKVIRVEGGNEINNNSIANDGFGLEMDVFDFNGDNVDDLLVGAPLSAEGRVYAYKGNQKGLNKRFDFVLKGEEIGSRFGSKISHGDLNGDSIMDFSISSYLYNKKGRVYIYNGSDQLDSSGLNYERTIDGEIENGWFGFSADIGDFNGDSFSDLAVGYLPYLNEDFYGSVSVFMGTESFMKESGKIADFSIEKPLDDSVLAFDLKLRDWNQDGLADLILGAPTSKGNSTGGSGDVYVLYGRSDEIDQKYIVQYRDVDEIIYGTEEDDWFGSSLEISDFDDDGLNDLIVGARYQDGINAVDNGKVFAIWGTGKYLGEVKTFDDEEIFVKRGEFVEAVVSRFRLREIRAAEYEECKKYINFCLYNFSARSSFNNLQFEPFLNLYPDVGPDNKYYESINLLTMLGVITGHLESPNSPFRPNETISRIQALKIILSANNLVASKYKFELIEMLGSEDALKTQTSIFKDVKAVLDHMWWYPRYLEFAVGAGIIDPKNEFFRPDEPVTWEELENMIIRTKNYLESNAKTEL